MDEATEMARKFLFSQEFSQYSSFAPPTLDFSWQRPSIAI